jgi:hypothetical protein
MIITPLDKMWARRETRKLVREGKIRPSPCAICGALETKIHHLDYDDPTHVIHLCKGHRDEAHLSPLQQALLKRGLFWYYRTPLDEARGIPFPGSFWIRSLMRKVKDRAERHRRRAAAGLSLHRLTGRGLLEHCSRGSWRLTPAGVKLASGLYPEIKPLTKEQVEEQLARDRREREMWERIAPLAPRKRIKRADKERMMARLREEIHQLASQKTGSGVKAGEWDSSKK